MVDTHDCMIISNFAGTHYQTWLDGCEKAELPVGVIDTYQEMLGCEFKQLKSSIPHSAGLIEMGSAPGQAQLLMTDREKKLVATGLAKHDNTPLFPVRQLGQRMLADRTLPSVVIPSEAVTRVILRSPDLTKSVEWGDASNAFMVLFFFIALSYGNVSSCTILFDHLAAQMHIIIPCLSVKSCKQKCEKKWRNGRVALANVRPTTQPRRSLEHPHALPPSRVCRAAVRRAPSRRARRKSFVG